MTQEDIVGHKDREGRDSVWGSSPQQYVFSVGQKHGDGLETQVNGDCVSERVSSSANSRVLAKNSDASDGQVGDTVHVTKSQVWLDTSVVSRTSDINKKGCMCLPLTEYLYSAAHLDGSTAQNSSERNLGGRQEVMMATLSPTTCCTTTDIHLRSKSGGSTTHLPTEAFPGCTKDDQAAITTTNDSSTDTHHPHTQMIVDEQQDTVWNDSRGTLTDKHTQSSPQNLTAGVGYQNTTTTDKRKPFNQRHLAEFVPIQKASGENLREETRRIVMMLRNDKTCKVPRPSLGLQDRVQSLVQRSTGKRTSYIKGPRFCNTFVKTIVKQSHDKLQTRRDSFQELKKSRREQTAQRVLVNPAPCYGGVDVIVSTAHGPPSDVDGGVGWPHQDGAATWRDDKETPALTLTAVSPSSTITASRGYSLQKDMNYQQENRDKNKGDEVTDANKTDINKQCINMNEVEHLSREMVAVARSLDGGSVGNLNQNTQHLPEQQEFNNHMVLQRKSIGATESSITLQGKLTNTIDQYCVSSWPLVSQMNRSDVTHQPVPPRDVVSQPSETMVDSDPVCERDYVAVDVNEEHNKTDEVLGETAGRSTIMSGSSDHPTTSVFSTSVSSTSASSTSASSTSASSTSTSSTSVSSTSTSSTSVSSTSVSSATVSSTKVSLISRISDKMEVLLTTASTETTDSSSSLKNKSESMKCTRKPSGDTVDLKAHIASLNKVSLNHRGSVQKRQFNGQNVKTSPSTLSEVMDTDTGGSANMSVTPGTDQTPSVKHEGNLFIQGDANSTGVTRLWPSAAIMTQQDASSANSDHLQKPEREGEESSSSWSCLGDIIRLKTDNLVARHRGIRSRLYSITTLPQHPKTQQSSSSVPPQRSKTRPFTTNVRPQHEVDGVISGDKSGDTVDSRPPLPINNRQGSVDGRPPIHPTSRQSSIDDQPHPPNSRQGSVDISKCVGQRNSERYPRPRHDSTDGQGSFQPERRRNRSNTRHRDSRQDSKSRVNPVSRSGSINTCLTHPGERRDSKIVGVRSGSCCGSRVSFGQDLLRKFLEVAVDQYDSMEWEETQVEENTTNSTLLQEELNSSLRKAVCHRNAEETRSLLKLGADPNVSCGPSPALLRAAKDGTLYVLQALLAAGADADARSDLGNSALHVAARSGYSEVAIQLVNSGAFVDAINRSGVTPLQMALAHGHLEVARTLLRLNADVFLPNKVGETAYEVMNQLGYMGLTACPREMRRDSAPGSKVESPSTQIPLPVRLIKAIEDGCPATVETCLAEGAPPNTMVPLALHWPARATVLHRAAHHGHDLIVRLLLAAGSDINKKDVVGNTPLHAATQAGHNRVVKILLGHGALLDAASQSGMTSLHRAASKGKELTCNLLLRRGANPRAEDNAGRTPADWARKRGFKSVAKKLVYRRKNSVTLEGESQQHQHYLHRLNQLHQAALRGGHQQPDTPDCCEE
ncbi:serine-rich adhesin for platelets-like [Homarus americanus]|uniref:serine-rich adhesin for platelets-like n=1 Tax=Homarus americanus TaxID=6706 RepID=UPI001C46B4B5|nr:serine-rich adhesin for platelets-like [Homarus americanus]